MSSKRYRNRPLSLLPDPRTITNISQRVEMRDGVPKVITRLEFGTPTNTAAERLLFRPSKP